VLKSLVEQGVNIAETFGRLVAQGWACSGALWWLVAQGFVYSRVLFSLVERGLVYFSVSKCLFRQPLRCSGVLQTCLPRQTSGLECMQIRWLVLWFFKSQTLVGVVRFSGGNVSKGRFGFAKSRKAFAKHSPIVDL
jgi:hypothetical protein